MAVMSSAEAVGIVCSRMHAQPCQYLIRHSTRLLRCHSIPAAEERGGGEPADGVAGFAALSWSIQRSAYNTVQQGNVPLSLDTSVKVNSARALRLGRRQSWSLSLRFQEKCGEETRSTEGTASSSSPRWTESEIGGRLVQSGARFRPLRPYDRLGAPLPMPHGYLATIYSAAWLTNWNALEKARNRIVDVRIALLTWIVSPSITKAQVSVRRAHPTTHLRPRLATGEVS
jgi:hypothetical protein